MALRILKVDGAISATGIDEFGGDDASGAHEFAVAVQRLEHHGEAIAGAQIAVEIDLAREDVGELYGHAVAQSSSVGRSEQ